MKTALLLVLGALVVLVVVGLGHASGWKVDLVVAGVLAVLGLLLSLGYIWLLWRAAGDGQAFAWYDFKKLLGCLGLYLLGVGITVAVMLGLHAVLPPLWWENLAWLLILPHLLAMIPQLIFDAVVSLALLAYIWVGKSLWEGNLWVWGPIIVFAIGYGIWAKLGEARRRRRLQKSPALLRIMVEDGYAPAEWLPEEERKEGEGKSDRTDGSSS